MHTESSEPVAASDQHLERAIVLALLIDDDGAQRRWTRVELGECLESDEHELQDALERLLGAAVICVADGLLWASAAARRLDELELIAI
jgi:hypothetical protein